MSYQVEVESRAKREFIRLSGEAQERVAEAIDALKRAPRPPGAKRLVGKTGYRIRLGDFRVLYTIDDQVKLVRIYRIGHRRDVYRGL